MADSAVSADGHLKTTQSELTLRKDRFREHGAQFCRPFLTGRRGVERVTGTAHRSAEMARLGAQKSRGNSEGVNPYPSFQKIVRTVRREGRVSRERRNLLCQLDVGRLSAWVVVEMSRSGCTQTRSAESRVWNIFFGVSPKKFSHSSPPTYVAVVGHHVAQQQPAELPVKNAMCKLPFSTVYNTVGCRGGGS